MGTQPEMLPHRHSSEGAEELDELSEARHVIVEPDFLPAAQRLRAVFDERFEDPRRTHRERKQLLGGQAAMCCAAIFSRVKCNGCIGLGDNVASCMRHE